MFGAIMAKVIVLIKTKRALEKEAELTIYMRESALIVYNLFYFTNNQTCKLEIWFFSVLN